MSKSPSFLLFTILAFLAPVDAVLVNYANAQNFRNLAAQIDVATTVGAAGTQWLFTASVGKRGPEYLLDRGFEILQATQGGVDEDQQAMISRFIRGYTTQDYQSRDTLVSIGFTLGGNRDVDSNVIWQILAVADDSPITAMDVLGLHLVMLVIAIMRPTVQQLQNGLPQFPVLQSAVRMMHPATRPAEVQAAVARAISNTRQRAFPDAATAQARITELNNRLHSAILSLQIDPAKLVALNINPTEF